MSTSLTGGPNVSIDLAVIKAGVSGQVSGGVAYTISGTESITGSMSVRPHQTGHVQGGIFRVVTDGNYTTIDTTCHTSVSHVNAHSPYEWGFVVTGG